MTTLHMIKVMNTKSWKEKIMNKLISTILLVPLLLNAGNVAKININEIKDAGREYLFSIEKYSSLKQKYENTKPYNPIENIKKGEDGRISFNQALMEVKSGDFNRYAVELELLSYLKNELILMIDEMELGYDVIIERNRDSSILYSNTVVDDITHKIKLELLKRSKAK